MFFGAGPLDNPVGMFLPNEVRVPDYNGMPITLLNLAAQDSGLPFNSTNLIAADTLTAYNAYAVSDLYEFLSEYDPGQAPGTEFQYSNVGFSLLGDALGEVAESDFQTLLINRILDPLDRTRRTSAERRSPGWTATCFDRKVRGALEMPVALRATPRSRALIKA